MRLVRSSGGLVPRLVDSFATGTPTQTWVPFLRLHRCYPPSSSHNYSLDRWRGVSSERSEYDKTTTVDADEVKKFSKLSRKWWDSKGPMAPLHKMNGERLSFIREKLVRHFQRDPCTSTPLHGLSILDGGCGAGLLSEVRRRSG